MAERITKSGLLGVKSVLDNRLTGVHIQLSLSRMSESDIRRRF